MIKVKDLNKYFNKGKQNEIHVINNTTLEFPKKGLITLLGPSGCGKTTLLNVIGGLDKTGGTITFKDQVISKYNSRVWDKLRVNNIGYIFQNYYLLENKTVKENIEIVLTMMGITNDDEIKYRSEYVLKAVGMDRYKNKLASDLSGGQKQRVAIARAVVKNPDVIIADEPTGNLDSNNSIEVLKIIKEISKDKLVILVTHNIDLANYYSDRIIKISDGKVTDDEQNKVQSGDLSYVDTNIYLKDLNKITNENINIYSDEELKDINLTLVKIGNNYYLKTDEKNVTVEILSDKKEIKLLDEHQKDVEQTFTQETTFNLEELEAYKTPRTKPTIYKFKDSLIQALRKLTTLGRKGKMQIFALVYLGIMFTTSFLLFTSAIFVDDSYIDDDLNHYTLNANREVISYQNYSEEAIVYSDYRVYLKKGEFKTLTTLNIYPKEAIDKENTPANTVYIDEEVLNKNYQYQYIFEAFGIFKKEHLNNQLVTIDGVGDNLIIKGTVKTGNHAIYVDSSLLTRGIINNFWGLSLYSDDIVLNESLAPKPSTGKYLVYLSETAYNKEREVLDSIFQNGSDYKVVGYYADDLPYLNYEVVIKEDELRKMSIENNKITLQLYLKGDNIPSNAVNTYEQNIKQLKDNRQTNLIASISQSLIALLISVVIFYFLVRSSLTNRRKEISILRSLGISKREVKKLFAVEYFVLTTATSLIGVFIGSFVARAANRSFLEGLVNLRVNVLTFVLTIVLVYIINIITSLIPVSQMLRKTPATLLSSYDL